MRRPRILTLTACGLAAGGFLLHAQPAYADLPVIDAASIIQEIKQVTDLGGIESAINSLLGTTGPLATLMGNNAYGTVQQLLQEGFTQEANYSKATVGAMQNITDASDEAMAQYDLQLRDAQIRDEQTASPTACAALDNGVSVAASSIQGDKVGSTLDETLQYLLCKHSGCRPALLQPVRQRNLCKPGRGYHRQGLRHQSHRAGRAGRATRRSAELRRGTRCGRRTPKLQRPNVAGTERGGRDYRHAKPLCAAHGAAANLSDEYGPTSTDNGFLAAGSADQRREPGE
jgi:hypothetical protein